MLKERAIIVVPVSEMVGLDGRLGVCEIWKIRPSFIKIILDNNIGEQEKVFHHDCGSVIPSR
jgi:hypothetical protein